MQSFCRVGGVGLAAAALAVGLLVGGCGGGGPSPPAEPTEPARPATRAVPDGPPLMKDVTADAGVVFTYRNGEEAGHLAILESLGGGAALIDYDRDGLLDVFLPGGGHYDGADKQQILGHPCKLYRNLGG